MAFISYEEYKQRRTNGESASSIVRESFGNQSSAGQGFPDFEEYQRLRNSGQSAKDIVSAYLQPRQQTQKITRHEEAEAPVTRRASSAPIVPEIEQRRQSTREAAGTARDQARQNLESLKSERAEIGGYIYDDFTAALYADKIAELDRQIAEASKNYKAKDQEYKDVYAGYNAARKELQQAQYNYSQAFNEYRGEEDDQRVKDAETRLANARRAFEEQGGNPDASVVSAGLKGSAAGVVDTFGYLQELGQPENEKSWGIFTTGHMTEAQKHHQEVLAQREKERYEAEHGAGTYTETPAYLRTQDTAAKLARESAEEIKSMKAGRGELGQIAVDMGVQGVQMGADAIVGKVLPGGSLTAMALRTFGSSVREARDEGANIYQQGLYGAGSAAVEVLTEKMFDGLAGVYGAGVADDIVSHMIGKITDNRLGQAALEWAADALGEGLEEVASDAVNPLLRTIYNDMSVGESYRENLDWQEVGYDFLIGALMGFAGGSVENVANITGVTAPDERSDFFMQAGQSGMSFKDAMNTWHKHMIKEGYATKTSDQEITNQANEYLNRLESGKRVSERKINKLNQRATNTIAQEDIANTVNGVQQRMQQFGINDPKLAQAITALALENEAERIGAKGVGATEAQRKMVEDSSIAKRILSEMDVENMRREQAAGYINTLMEMGGASDEELQRNIEPYQRTNEWAKNLKGNKALAADVYGTQNTVTEAEKNAVTMNGESVKIVGAENGKVIVEQNGERQTVDAGKLENMSDSYKQLVSASPAGQSGEAFLRLYKSSQDVAAYAKAWDLAENMYGAQTNVSFEEARQRSSLKVLTDAQLQMALDIGRERYNANKAKAEERGKQLKQAREEAKKRGAEQRKKGTVSYDGGEVNGVKYKGIDKSKLSVAQKRVVAMVEALADAVNIDYVLFEGEANTGGSYIQGGTVYINIKAGEYSGKTLGAATLSHELTHYLQDFAPEEYQELKDFLIAEIIKQSPAQFEKLVQKQLMLEPDLNYDQATDEMIANACQKMLLNSEAVTKLARQNMNLAEKIRDAISEISDKIKAAFEDVDMSDNVPVFEAARSIENVMDKAQALWDKALEAATENYNAAQATGMKADGGVQNMLIGVREDGIEVYETSPEIKRLPWKEKRKKFLDIMSNEYRGRTAKFFRNGHTYYARFEDVDAQKTIFGDNDSDQTGRDAKTNLGADGDIFTLVENAEWFGGEVEREKPGKAHKDVKYWDYYLKTVQIDGRVFDLLVNVRQKVGDSFVYSLELYERKDVKAASPRSFSEEKRSPGVPTASNQIISDESAKSNTEIDAGDTAFEYDAETESVNEQHQLLTWEASDYVTERNKAAKEIADKLGISQKKAKDYIDSVNSVAKYIAENKGRLDYEDTGRSPFVGNVEYGGSFDFTTLCKKRRLLTGTFSAIQQALANTALTANEILEIRKMMDDAGLEVSCGKCYVEGSRASMGIFTKEFLKLYEKYNPGAWVPNMAQMNTPDGIEWVRVNHPEVYEQYEYFWNHYGTLRPGDPNLFASQQKPKLYQMRSAYKGEVLKHFKNDGSIQEKNRNGGLRMQSFSAFEIVHLLDAMQVIMDMSRVGLNGQAYTKVPDFAWALGKTGLKINLSIDAWDVVDGKLVFNNKEGMNFDEAMRIRDANSKNVGTICCVYDDAQLLAALADPRIDFIIPFHRSQWKKSQYKGMGLPATTKDYTYQQNEKWLNPSAHTHEYRGRQVKDKCTNYMPNEYWDFSKSGKENAEEYLRMCARDGKRPKFYKFLTNNGDGSYSLKSDGSTDGYWKLLIDFKMYDNEGNGSPQMPVKPDFNMEEIRRMLESYEGGHNSFPVAHGVVNQFVDKYKAAHPGQQFQKLGDVETEAVNHFGTTDNFRTAGYLLKDGQMLDFSGAHWLEGYDDKYVADWRKKNDIRQVDHEDVFEAYEAMGDDFPSDSSLDFIKRGNVRMVPESPGIELYYKTEPTAEQYSQIKSFIREAASDSQHYRADRFTVDLTKDRTHHAGTLSYSGKINADRVVNDIKHFYATGEVREQGLSQFYQKLGIGETAEEQEARKESFDNLKAENKILRARAEYWKAQTRPTKERTVRQQDTDRLANELLKKYESRADKAEVKDALKELGDWLVQTEELDYDELRTKAEAIAEDIISGNYALLDNSQQENLDRLKDYLKSTPVNLSKADFRDTGDEGFRKKYGRYFTVSERGRTIDSLWGEMAAMFGDGVFPEDVYAPGDMLNMIADYLDMWKPQYGNEFEMFRDEAVNAATNEIIDAILSEDVRQSPATYADKAQQKLNSQIAKDRERLDALREAKNARIEELKRQASEKNAQIRLAEKAAKYEAVSKVKKHYQDMLKRQRNKRGDTKVRAKIKKLHKELSDMLVKPRNGHYVPKELVKATADILGAIDTTTGKSIKASTAFAELKIKYDALKNKPGEYESARQASDRVLLYDEGISEMIQKIAENVGDSRIYDLTGENLENIYTTLKALKHTIVTANKLVGAKIEANAFEAATQMMNETDMAKGIPTKALRRFALAQMTPSSAFRAFGGYKKNSMWEQMFNELNNGQLTQTQILMEGGQIFRELIDDKKNMAKLHDQKNLVDIGLKDSQGNAIKVTRGMMLSVYMHLLNEQNAKHVAYGGLKVPRLKQYYKNEIKEAYSLDAAKTATNAEAIAELNDQLKEAQSVEEQDAIKEKLAELNDKTEAFMNNLRSEIEKQLTDYDRKWVAAAQTFFDEYSKNKLNEVTEMIYGFEKAQVDHYFPIHTDPNFRAASFDTIVRDFSLENAGFMKERVNSATPIYLEDITDVISSQLRRTAQYVGLMPAIRNFNKVYGKARAGYSNSVQEAMSTKFGDQGMKYVENLMADLNGARKTEANIFDELRGNMAGAVLTLNPRVAMAQAASYPTAASEIGYKPLIKALKDIKNNPNWNEVARDEVAKWTPLWWYRMQGFSTVELGDIKNNEQALSKVLQKMKWATGWIQFMDGATTGALWQASKYYVDENFTDLKKGSDEYMMKVAEVYNRVLEKTQPDYTTMQRPDILRNPNAIVKQLTMFMTQRLQNTNILYDAAATYSHYLRDAEAGRNGVTAADVKQAKTRLVWAVSSQVAAGATIVIFKAIADALMHNLKAYRDDDDELTAESISKTMLTNFAETLTSNVLWGSELFAALKSVVTGDRYYGISLNGVDTFKDILEDGVKTLSKAWKGDWEGFKAPAWKLSKAVAQFFGIPLGNAEKVGKMTANWFEDARNGTWYESDVDRTKAQNTHILFDALQRGDTAKAARIRQEYKDKKDEQSALKSYIQELYTDKDQKIQKAETIKLLQRYAGMTKREAEDLAQKWTMGVVTGIKFSELQDKYIAGEIPKAKAEKYYKDYSSNGRTTEAEAKAKVLEWTCEKETGIAYSDIGTEVKTGRLAKEKAIQMVMKYGGKDQDAATKIVNGYLIEHEYDLKPSELEDEYLAGNVSDSEALEILQQYRYYGKENAETKAQEELERLKFVKANPDAEDISLAQVRNYNAAGLEGVVDASTYAEAAKMMGTFHGVDADGNGKTDPYSIIVQKLEYIDTLDLDPEQKTRLAQALGISDKNIRRRAPWR